VDSTTDPLSLTLSPLAGGEGTERLCRIFARNRLDPNNEINDMLSSQSIIGAAWRAAAAASTPARVMMFGSYARGDADEDSDLDLVVIEREVTDKAAEYLKLHRAIGLIGVGVDVLVFSVDEFARRSQVPGTVAYWAKQEGKLLYDADS